MSKTSSAKNTIVTRTVTIINQRGLHARAAAKFVKVVSKYKAQVNVRRDEVTVSGNSIMGLMMLAAGPGVSLILEASGLEAQLVINDLADLIERKFDEGE